MAHAEASSYRTALTTVSILIEHIEGNLRLLKAACDHRGLSNESYLILKEHLERELDSVKNLHNQESPEEHFVFKRGFTQLVDKRIEIDVNS
jgi:hypothetical protein